MDKELIEHIKESLSAHEEAYTPGAWERFAAQEEKKRRGFILWPLWSAAALILIFGGLFFLKNDSKTVNQLADKKAKPKTETSIDTSNTTVAQPATQQNLAVSASKTKKPLQIGENLTENTVAQTLANSKKTNLYTDNKTTALQQDNYVTDLTTALKQNENNLIKPENNFNIANNNVKKAELIIKKQKPAPNKLTFEDILARDSYAGNQIKTDKTKGNNKWEPGVYVAPAMGNDNKLNMNYGFSLSYNVADKISISSGIAYTSLSSTSNPTANNYSSFSDAAYNSALSSSATVNASKSLQSVNANVRGINIPLELKYNISKKFYTGVGVSALAVLNNQQDNNYIVSSAQNRTVANTAGGYVEQQMFVVTERVTETQPAATTSADKYIGFYNFSLGYKQKISGKKNFAVEPFLRVPMKTFSKDNLNLTNGGLRLKLDF